MRKITKNNNYIIFIPLLILIMFSILNMINAAHLLTQYDNYYFKQILWVIIGFLIIISMSKLNIKYFFKYSYVIYIINILFLILVLFFGKNVNGAKAWFDFGFLSFQPSEMMKLSLLLLLCNLTNSLKYRTVRNEFKFIIKVIILTLIPSILTFLEPDTGAVIIYLVIMLSVLYASRIRLKWFIFFLLISLSIVISIYYFYITNEELFIKIFGTDIFYRIDRLKFFKDGSGMQIENALIAMGSAGFFGTGIENVAIYFPEAPTDFIFALSVSNFGLIGGFLILFSYLIIFIWLLKQINKNIRKEEKIFIISFLGMFLFQCIQSILMNLGLLPIIGITLPFLSYGGSSTLLYFTCFAFILRIIGKKKYP